MKNQIKRLNKNGFTLIELLIVIAIIAILAAILFPVFGRARENARRSACQSNLKQLGLSMAQYSQDYDESIVPACNRAVYIGPTGGALWGSSAFAWTRLLQPYLKSDQIFRCGSQLGNIKVGYTMNAFPRVNSVTRLSAITSPTLTPDLVEAVGNPDGQSNDHPTAPFHSLIFGQTYTPTTTLSSAKLRNRINPGAGSWEYQDNTPTNTGYPNADLHLEGCNYLFMDGHVKWLKPNGRGGPASNGLDYDGNGVTGGNTSWS